MSQQRGVCYLEETFTRWSVAPTKIPLKSLQAQQAGVLKWLVFVFFWCEKCARKPYGRPSRSFGTASQSKKSTRAGWANARRAQSRHKMLAATLADQRSTGLWLKRRVAHWRQNEPVTVCSTGQDLQLCFFLLLENVTARFEKVKINLPFLSANVINSLILSLSLCLLNVFVLPTICSEAARSWHRMCM